MLSHIIRIGNSQGIRIPKTMLLECDIKHEVNLKIDGSNIVIEPVKTKTREGWTKSFKLMKANKDDKLIINNKVDPEMENWKW